MANIQELLKKLDPKNSVHKKIIESLNQTTDLYSKLINDTVNKKSTPDSIERIVGSIDENINFNNSMISGKDRRGNISRANVFKLNAVVSATRLASNIEDFTRIEIIPVNSKSESAQKAIFVARNIDGVLESSINSIMSLSTSSDTTEAIAALEAKGKFEKTVKEGLDKLHGDVTKQLENGVGTRYQLLIYNRDKAREQFDKITKELEGDKSIEEISESLKISIPGIKSVENDVRASIDKKKIETNIEKVKKALKAKDSYKKIATDLGVNLNRLSNYCRQNGLLEYNEKKFINDNLEKVEKLLSEGKTFTEIATELSVNETRLVSIARNNKLSEKKEEVKAS